MGERTDTPSKANATTRYFGVGVTDIHTPSVVRIADPANVESTKWFNAKLFPTDCSPVKHDFKRVV